MAGAVSSKMATIVVVIPLLVLAYFLAPMALPVWRWQHLNDWTEVAKKLAISEKEAKQEYKVVMRYNPRGDTDPYPWQIISMDPPWVSINDKRDDEDHVLVRCTLISDRDGGPPSKLFLGSGGPAAYKDRYWKGVVWRFPPGAFGFGFSRPLVVYRGDMWEKMEIAEAEALHTDIGGNFGGGKYSNDDDKPDGFKGH
jgi:hypothetical protein